MEQNMKPERFYLPTPLQVQPRFMFVNVFKEAVQYCRIYNLPFIAVCVCLREDPDEPSTFVNLKTGEIKTLHKNDVYLVLPGVSRRYTYTTGNEHLVIHFRLELFPGTSVFPEDGSCFLINSLELRRECEEIFQISDPIQQLAGCLEFSMKICRIHWPQNYVLDLEVRRFFEPVMNYIREQVSAKTQIGELAEILGCSEDLFSRKFHALFGQSPKKYLQKELLSRAALLLVDQEMNIKEIATKLGFSSEFYFSNFFKRLSGISPSEYRQQSNRVLSPKNHMLS